MQQNDNNWLDAVKDSIESIEEPLPEGMWDSVAADMAATARRRKVLRISLGGIAAAAAVMAGIFLIMPQDGDNAGVTLLAESNAVRQTTEAAPAAAGPVDMQAEEPAVESKPSRLAAATPEATEEAPAATALPAAEPAAQEPAVQKPAVQKPAAQEPTTTSAPKSVPVRDLLAELSEPVPSFEPEPEPEHHSRLLAAGLNFATGGGSGTSGSAGHISTSLAAAEEPAFATRAGISDNHSGYRAQYAHNMPVNFGISLSIGLTERLSLETGLNYAYHSALRNTYLNDYLMGSDRQEIHFAGIPLGLRFSAVEMHRASLYLYGGVMTQKCIYASWNGSHLLIDPVVLSSELSAGFQYQLAGPMYLYIEPGVTHASVSGESSYTMYNDAPWNFNLKGGLRFSIQ